MASNQDEINNLIRNLSEKIENEEPTKEEVKNELLNILGKGKLGVDIQHPCGAIVLKNRTDLVELIFNEKAFHFDAEDLTMFSYEFLLQCTIWTNFEMLKFLVEEMKLDVNEHPGNLYGLILHWAMYWEAQR
jgi:hypothetical protein